MGQSTSSVSWTDLDDGLKRPSSDHWRILRDIDGDISCKVCAHAEALRRELLDRLDAPDFGLASRPVKSIVGDIRASLGAFIA